MKSGVSLNSREVEFDMVFRRVKVVFCIGSLLQQATVTVRSIEANISRAVGRRESRREALAQLCR